MRACWIATDGLATEPTSSDGTHIKLADDSVDMILLNHVFHEVDHTRRVLSEFLRMMKPYGRLAIVERTGSRSILSGKLGPLIINEAEVIKELELAGFRFVRTIPHGRDSIIIARKTA